MSRAAQQPERVCANCLCRKLLLFGWVVFWVCRLRKASGRYSKNFWGKNRERKNKDFSFFGDKVGESLRGSQAPPSFWKVPGLPWKVPGLPWKFPKLPRKFFGNFPGSSLTVELDSNPGVPQKFPAPPWKFPGLFRRSAPFSGKPDTLS